MATHEKLGEILVNHLIKLREQEKTIDFSNVGKIFEEISTTLNSSSSGIEESVINEIKQLDEFLKRAKQEFAEANGSSDESSLSNDATPHLNAIIKNTEDATHSIIDAVGSIQEGISDSLSPEAQGKVDEAIGKIYEACNFQDLTHQRIKKVINMIEKVDERITRIVALFNKDEGLAGSASTKSANNNADDGKSEEEKLLNGPQLPDNAKSQMDVDALFDSLPSD